MDTQATNRPTSFFPDNARVQATQNNFTIWGNLKGKDTERNYLFIHPDSAPDHAFLIVRENIHPSNAPKPHRA